MKMKNKMIILAVFPALCIAGCFRETDSFAEWEERLEALDAVEERLEALDAVEERLEALDAVLPSSPILAELSFVRRYMEEYVRLLQAVKSGGEFDVNSGLGYAILFGDMENAKLFIGKGANVNSLFKDMPMLHLAAWLCRPEMVKLLIENGANVNAPDPILKELHALTVTIPGVFPATCAFQAIPDRNILDYCKAAVTNPEEADFSGSFFYPIADRKATIKTLLDSGTIVTEADKILLLSNDYVRADSIDSFDLFVEMLRLFGVVPTSQNSEGAHIIFNCFGDGTPLMQYLGDLEDLVPKSYYPWNDDKKRYYLIRILVYAGMDVNIRDDKGRALLSYALRCKKNDDANGYDSMTVNYLLFKGAKL